MLPQTPKPISPTAMISAPATVGSLVDRGSVSYQVPPDSAERSAIFLLAIAQPRCCQSLPGAVDQFNEGGSPGPVGTLLFGLRPVIIGMISSRLPKACTAP